jgi:Mg2+ and Co2+ transporter CorA
MTTVYDLSHGRARPVDSAEWPPGTPATGTSQWIRVVGAPREELRRAIIALRLPDEFTEALQAEDAWSRVSAGTRTLVVVLPVLEDEDGPAHHLRVVCTPTTLVTAEEEALSAIDRVVTDWDNTARPEATLPVLLVDVLEAAVSNGGVMYLSLRRRLDELAQAVEHDPLEVPPTALLTMKRRVAQLSMLWEGQSYCLIEIKRRRSHVSPSDHVRERLGDLVSDADRGLKLLAAMESRVRDLRLHHVHCLQESTNRRLNLLAMLSAIYLPPTLVAGIYGMNLQHIPMTQLRYGYLIVMAVMGALVLGQLWYFRQRGWFR